MSLALATHGDAPEEEAIRQDIVATMDKANPKLRNTQRVGGKWDGVDEKGKVQRAKRAAAQRAQSTKYWGKE